MKTPLVLLAVLLALAAPAADAPLPGLTVSNGLFLLQGAPVRAVGVNYFSLFSRTLANPDDRSYETGLRQLADAGIPFVRFMACGFWPADWDLYLTDKPAYFARLDAVVRCAEAHRVALVPSLFWHIATVPDLVGEPLDQLGNPDSKTHAFIRQYTRETVTRYRTSPAVWAWEFGNEYALHADLPDADKHRPAVWPTLKTAPVRTSRDDLTSAAMLTAFGLFARTVRELDPSRPLITGNALPRPYAYHNSLDKSWAPDTPEQFASVLLRDNPDPFDTLSVHIYPKPTLPYPGGSPTLARLVADLQTLARRHRKPLFIGEFGAPATLPPDEENARFDEILQAIRDNAVPLSALWVFDFPHQDKDWNVTFANRRAYMLQRVAAANRAD